MEPKQPVVEVRRSNRRRRTMSAWRDGDTIVVAIPGHMSRAEEARQVPALVERLLAKEVRTRAPRGEAELVRRAVGLAREHLLPHAPGMPMPADVVWVSNQRTRWASCTPETRTIRLSTRLQAMPAWVVDYVLCHELTHLVHPGHSPEFWALVGRYPQAERARGYLDGWADARRQPGGPVPDDGDVD